MLCRGWRANRLEYATCGSVFFENGGKKISVFITGYAWTGRHEFPQYINLGRNYEQGQLRVHMRFKFKLNLLSSVILIVACEAQVKV